MSFAMHMDMEREREMTEKFEKQIDKRTTTPTIENVIPRIMWIVLDWIR